MQTHDTLRGGSRARLTKYRRALTDSLATIRGNRTPEAAEAFIQSAGYTSPLRHRYGWTGDAYITHSEDGRKLHAETGALDHLREPSRDDLPRDYGCKWYADAYCSETITGKVAQLPHGRFLAYIVWSDCDGITIDASVYDTAREAANAADNMAERTAEEEREHNQRWNEARDANDERDEARDESRKARKLFRTLAKAYRVTRADDLRAVMQDAREAVARMIEKTEYIAELDMTGEF